MFFEKSGAGDERVAGSGDIVDEPYPFVSEKILRRALGNTKGVFQIFFASFSILLS